MAGYNNKLNADDQVSAEEAIATIIRDRTEQEIANAEENGVDSAMTDEDAADLGRQILLTVLSRFRPDLIDK